MTDPNKLRPHELAHEVLQDTAMDQALDWLIALQCPAPGQQAEFEAWLAAGQAQDAERAAKKAPRNFRQLFQIIYRLIEEKAEEDEA